jgi:hypothetical protein
LIQACSSSERVIEPSPLPSGGGGSIVFVTQSGARSEMMTALFDGEIVLDAAGCLRVVSNGAESIIWPKGFTLAELGTDYLVRDADGRDVGRIGGRFRLGGGSIPTLHGSVPISAEDRDRVLRSCPGRYWLVGSVVR